MLQVVAGDVLILVVIGQQLIQQCAASVIDCYQSHKYRRRRRKRACSFRIGFGC
jgi:hypothetical protein